MEPFQKMRIIGLAAIVLASSLPSTSTSAQLAYLPATGHYYEPVKVPEGITWDNAYTNAINRRGYLCTITSASENAFVASLVDASYYSTVSSHGDILGPWFGGLRHANESTWRWVTGEAFTYSNWHFSQPDGFGGSEQRLQFYAGASAGSTWGDHPGGEISGFSLPRGYIVEYNSLPVEITQSNNTTVVSWLQTTNNWILERATNLSANPIVWSPISTNAYQSATPHVFFTITNNESQAFFRLRQN